MPSSLESIITSTLPGVQEAEKLKKELQSGALNARSNLYDLAKNIFETENAEFGPLKQQIMSDVATSNPNITQEQARELAGQRFEKVNRTRSKELAALENGLQDAINKGGAKNLITMQFTPEQKQAIERGQPWHRTEEQARAKLLENSSPSRLHKIILNVLLPEEKVKLQKYMSEDIHGQDADKGVIGWTGWGLGSGGRAVQGAAAGFLESQREQPIKVEAPKSSKSFWDNLAMGLQQAGKDEATFTPEQSRAVLKGIEGGAKALVNTKNDIQMAEELRKIRFDIKKEAVAEANKLADDNKIGRDKNTVMVNAERIFYDKIKKHPLSIALIDPEFAQGVTESIADPTNLVNPFAPAVKVLTKVPGIKQGVEGAKWLFSRDKQMALLEKAGMGDVASIGRMSKDIGDASVKSVQQLRIEVLPMLKLPENETKDLYQALHHYGPYKDMTDEQILASFSKQKMVDAFKASKLIEQESLKIKQDSGLFRRVNDETGLLEMAPTRENYGTPLKIQAEEFKKRKGWNALAKGEETGQSIRDVEQTGGNIKVTADVMSARAREANAPWNFEPDAYKQWDSSLRELERKLPVATEIKELAKGVSENVMADSTKIKSLPDSPEVKTITELAQGIKVPTSGIIKTNVTPRLQELDPNLNAQFGKGLEKSTGMIWETLQGDRKKLFSRLTGELGEKFNPASVDYWVPKPIANRISELELVWQEQVVKGKAKSLGTNVADFINSASIRPFMSAWRRGKTLLGAPVYFVNNAMGALGFNYLAHGIRGGFNWKLQSGAINGILASAVMGDKERLAKTFTHPLSGKTFTLKEYLDTADKLGIMDQNNLRLGLMAAGNKYSPLEWMNKATKFIAEKTTPGIPLPAVGPLKKFSRDEVNRAIENYQKLTIFMGFADDLHDTKKLAKALDLTSEYSLNYNRLTPFEKKWMSNTVGFYAFMRTSVPHLLKQMYKQPEKFLPFINSREYFQRKAFAEHPYSKEAVPSYLRGLAFPLPGSFKQKYNIENIDTSNYTMATIEDIYQLAVGALPAFESIFAKQKLPLGPDPTDYIGPLAQFMVELITKRDLKTEEDLSEAIPDLNWKETLQPVGAYGNLAKLRQSAIVKFLTSPADRMTKDISNMYEFFNSRAERPSEALRLRLLYKLGNDYNFVGNLYNQLVPGHIDDMIVPLIPGMRQYPTNVIDNQSGSLYNAWKDKNVIINSNRKALK